MMGGSYYPWFKMWRIISIYKYNIFRIVVLLLEHIEMAAIKAKIQ